MIEKPNIPSGSQGVVPGIENQPDIGLQRGANRDDHE
jgi:hypothetical protein